MLRRLSPLNLASRTIGATALCCCFSSHFLSTPHLTTSKKFASEAKTNNNKPPSSKNHFDTSKTEASWTDSIIRGVTEPVNYVYDSVASSWEGTKVDTVEDIKRNAPQWYHPLQRMKYRNYLLQQEQKGSMKMGGGGTKTSSSENPDNNSVNVSEQIRKLGLDPQSTFSVLLVYLGFWIAVVYFGLSVLYYSFAFYFFGYGLPRDPIKQSHLKDEQYNDEIIGLPAYVADKNRFVRQLQQDVTENNSCIVFHGDRGSGKSSLTRRVANLLAHEYSDKFSYVIYVRVNPSITSSDPLDIIGQYYGINSRKNVFWVLKIMNAFSTIGSMFSSSETSKKRKPLFVFDIHSAPTSSSSLLLKTGGQHNTFRSSIRGDGGGAGGAAGDSHAAASSFDLPLFSSSSVHGSGFDLSEFMNHASAIATDDEFTGGVVVCLNTTLLNTEAPSLVHSENVAAYEVGELSEPQALRLVSELTDEYVQSLMPFSKRTPRFLKKKLAKSINDVKKNDYEGDNSLMIPPLSHAKKILAEEYKLMESAASAVFENCRDAKKLRKIASENEELLWSDVEKYCGNKYGSNEHFRQIAELREGLFVSTGASTYKPRYDVIRNKILPGKKFMEK